jgi:K+-sensing histidine kinase KdpD
MSMLRSVLPRLGRAAAVAGLAVAVATVVVALLEDRVAVPNASSVYLVAVVVAAVGSGARVRSLRRLRRSSSTTT